MQTVNILFAWLILQEIEVFCLDCGLLYIQEAKFCVSQTHSLHWCLLDNTLCLSHLTCMRWSLPTPASVVCPPQLWVRSIRKGNRQYEMQGPHKGPKAALRGT